MTTNAQFKLIKLSEKDRM